VQSTTCERCGRPTYEDRALCPACDPEGQPSPIEEGGPGRQGSGRRPWPSQVVTIAACLVVGLVIGVAGAFLSSRSNNTWTDNIIMITNEAGFEPEYNAETFSEAIHKVGDVIGHFNQSTDAWQRAEQAVDSKDPSTWKAFDRATATRLEDARRELAAIKAITPPPRSRLAHWGNIVLVFQAELTYVERVRSLRASHGTEQQAKAIATERHDTVKRLWNDWLGNMTALAHWQNLDIQGFKPME
jgi:hypothetical protein